MLVLQKPRAKLAKVFPPHHTAYCRLGCVYTSERQKLRKRKQDLKTKTKQANKIYFQVLRLSSSKRPKMPFMSHMTNYHGHWPFQRPGIFFIFLLLVVLFIYLDPSIFGAFFGLTRLLSLKIPAVEISFSQIYKRLHISYLNTQ